MSDPRRACGPCTACCTVLGVSELAKAPYEACSHVCATGCGIHADRPGSCRSFDCQWLRGVLEVDGRVDTGLRPDSCGVIFDYQPDSPFGEAYSAWECEPGASTRRPARDIVRELAERFLVVVHRHPTDPGVVAAPEFVGPPHRVRAASDVLWGRRSDPGLL